MADREKILLKSGEAYLKRNDIVGFLNSLGRRDKAYMISFFLTQTNIPLFNFMTSIPERFFEDVDMNNIIIPGNIETIGKSAFLDATFKEIIIEDGVKKLGNGCFANCSNLNKIQLPNTITEIPTEAFVGCSDLKQLFIPDSVVNIGADAFKGCNNDIEITANYRDKGSPNRLRAKKADYEFLRSHLKFIHN